MSSEGEKWLTAEVCSLSQRLNLLAEEVRGLKGKRRFWLVGRRDAPTYPWAVWTSKPPLDLNYEAIEVEER